MLIVEGLFEQVVVILADDRLEPPDQPVPLVDKDPLEARDALMELLLCCVCQPTLYLFARLLRIFNLSDRTGSLHDLREYTFIQALDCEFLALISEECLRVHSFEVGIRILERHEIPVHRKFHPLGVLYVEIGKVADKRGLKEETSRV